MACPDIDLVMVALNSFMVGVVSTAIGVMIAYPWVIRAAKRQVDADVAQANERDRREEMARWTP